MIVRLLRAWRDRGGKAAPPRDVRAEPLEKRALFSAGDGGVVIAAPPAGDDGTTRVPAADTIAALQKTLSERGAPAGEALSRVLELSPFTGFFHS